MFGMRGMVLGLDWIEIRSRSNVERIGEATLTGRPKRVNRLMRSVSV